MDCERARDGLWPPERPKLVADGIAEARRHVDGCEACQDFMATDRELLDAYRRANPITAPLGVRERVFDALARARWDEIVENHDAAARAQAGASQRRRRLSLTTVASLAAVLVAVSVADVLRNGNSAGAADVFVEDYLRRAVGEDHVTTSDPMEVQRFLQRELGLRVDPIRYAGLELESAEICLIEGRRGAVIVYKRDGEAISHYVVPTPNAGSRAPAVSNPGQGSEMPVVTWSTSQAEQALVGETDVDELLRIAAGGAG